MLKKLLVTTPKTTQIYHLHIVS